MVEEGEITRTKDLIISRGDKVDILQGTKDSTIISNSKIKDQTLAMTTEPTLVLEVTTKTKTTTKIKTMGRTKAMAKTKDTTKTKTKETTKDIKKKDPVCKDQLCREEPEKSKSPLTKRWKWL